MDTTLALSFDEIVVATFTAGPGTPSLPIWIFNNPFREPAPVVNVVAVILWRFRSAGLARAARRGGCESRL